MGIFGRKKQPDGATFHLAARLQPQDRQTEFAEPLQALLDRHLPGAKIVGGGTEFDQVEGPLSCDLEVEIPGDVSEGAALVSRMLEHLGAPLGSYGQLFATTGRVPLGTWHAYALVLRNAGVPDELIEQHPASALVAELIARRGENARFHSWWENDETVSVYFAAADGAALEALLRTAPDLSPRAEGSTVVALTD